MNTQVFWGLIDEARGGGDPQTPSADPEALRKVLGILSDVEVRAVGGMFTTQVVRLNC